MTSHALRATLAMDTPHGYHQGLNALGVELRVGLAQYAICQGGQFRATPGTRSIVERLDTGKDLVERDTQIEFASAFSNESS